MKGTNNGTGCGEGSGESGTRWEITCKSKKTGALEEGTEIKERGNRMLRRSLLDGPPFHNELIDPSNWANPRAGTGHHALENRSDREQERENERDGRKRGTFAGTRGVAMKRLSCLESNEVFEGWG